jgi:large subunit ribosomal protein L21
MFAVVEISGNQVEVTQNKVLTVPLLQGNPGDIVEFTNILVSGDENSTNLGTPYLPGTVTAKIIEHGKTETILVFHKKRRKGYQKLNGHRTKLTTIEITDINFGAKKPAKKKVTKKDEVTEGEDHGS